MIFRGWIERTRDLGGIKFIVLRNGVNRWQVTVVKKKASEKVLNALAKITRESVIEVEGEFQEHPEAPGGREIIPQEIKILSQAKPIPLEFEGEIKTTLETRLDWRSLDLRQPKNNAVFRITSKLVQGMVEFLWSKGFIQVFTPCIIGAASEGGAEVFQLDYFKKKAFLRQDPQLHRQLTIAGGFEKIFDLGDSWRAEPSHTTKHLCEHRGIAVEVAFIKDERDLMRLQEDLVIEGIRKVKKECEKELETLNLDINVPSKPFPELVFPEIYDILEKMGKEIEFGEEYDRESEGLLADYVKEKYNTDFFFVNRFPFKAKPFYVMRVDGDERWARSIDLIYRGLEVSSGGQREHRYSKLLQNIKEKGINFESVSWFTKFFEFGVPPHGGFNLGIERLIMQLLELKNIREAALFPRAPERLLP